MNMELGLISRDAFMAQQRELERLREENAMLIRAIEGLAREIDSLTTLTDSLMASSDPS